MSDRRTHEITTTDGVTIRGTVHGHGPPLVFLPGGIGDGNLDWQALLPHLTGRFTSHLPSLRGRGLSDDHPNLGFDRLVDDQTAYVDSIGEPTGLVGWSAGGMVLAVAAQSDAVNAVAAVEPTMWSLMDDQERAAVGGAVARMGELTAQGSSAAAVRAFFGPFLNDEELAVAEDAGYFEATSRYVPTLTDQLRQAMGYPGPTADDPAVLGAITAPVMVLLGSDTKRIFAISAQHAADQVPDARIRRIPGAGHGAPLTHPEALADALTAFFSSAQQSA
jgi:pimeloyl-ACP methyl ester carboxylesterase